jgi:hypothetical protein
VKIRKGQQGGLDVPVVFIEPRPKGCPEGSAIVDYAVETSAGNVLSNFPSQDAAIDWAKERGYAPLIARVRHTHKGNRDHWQRI